MYKLATLPKSPHNEIAGGVERSLNGIQSNDFSLYPPYLDFFSSRADFRGSQNKAMTINIAHPPSHHPAIVLLLPLEMQTNSQITH